MNLATRVQHHPSRAPLLDELLPRLEGLDPEVVTDPGGQRPSSWRTYSLCLQSIPDDATHALIVQDDALPCPGFAEAITAAILDRPDRVIAAFVPGLSHLTRMVNQQRRKGSGWLDLPPSSFVPLVCTAYPAEVARGIVPFAQARKMPASRADDAVVGTFARARRIVACATLPCLVEHLEVPSAMGMRAAPGAPHRLAAWYAGGARPMTLP